jgi:hypothetical protein
VPGESVMKECGMDEIFSLPRQLSVHFFRQYVAFLDHAKALAPEAIRNFVSLIPYPEATF